MLRLRHSQPARDDATGCRDPGRQRRSRPRDPARLTMRLLVLGLGNEFAGDDAVGVLAVRAVRDAAPNTTGNIATDVVESAGSGLTLLEIFAGYDRAVVVDSIHTERHPPGT